MKKIISFIKKIFIKKKEDKEIKIYIRDKPDGEWREMKWFPTDDLHFESPGFNKNNSNDKL